jgi:hypothetical protein
MNSWWDRFVSMPLWAWFLYCTIAFALVTLLWPTLGLIVSVSLPRALLRGLLFGILMTSFIAVMQRRDRTAAGGQPVSRNIAVLRAIRTGEAPSDPTLDQALRGLLARRRAQRRMAAIVSPLLFGTLGVFSLLLAVADQSGVWVLMAGVFLGFVAFARWLSVRGAARNSTLEAQLNARSSFNPDG